VIVPGLRFTARDYYTEAVDSEPGRGDTQFRHQPTVVRLAAGV
jgi:hypothetical protein